MEVNKKILSIMRIIEGIPGFDRSKKMGYIYNANKLLTDADRVVLTDVMKAMILLTAGNQKAVRDPKSYDPTNAHDNYSWLLGQGVGEIIEKFNYPFALTADNLPWFILANINLFHEKLVRLGVCHNLDDSSNSDVYLSY